MVPFKFRRVLYPLIEVYLKKITLPLIQHWLQNFEDILNFISANDKEQYFEQNGIQIRIYKHSLTVLLYVYVLTM